MLRKQFEVNLFGLFAVTKAFAPLLGMDLSRQGKPGRIINISSVSGKVWSLFVGAYVASKHALEGMSETLRRELMLFGIDVIIFGPGAIRTQIHLTRHRSIAPTNICNSLPPRDWPRNFARICWWKYSLWLGPKHDTHSFRSRSGTGFSRDCFPSAGSTR